MFSSFFNLIQTVGVSDTPPELNIFLPKGGSFFSSYFLRFGGPLGNRKLCFSNLNMIHKSNSLFFAPSGTKKAK